MTTKAGRNCDDMGRADDDQVDPALAGLIALDRLEAQELDETWFATARWREVARVLLAHRRHDGKLGDLLTATDVLVADTTLYCPRTCAADAILAALDARPICRFIERARERAIRLRLQRAARALDTIAVADRAIIPAHIARVQKHLSAVEAGLGARSPA